MQRPQLIVFDLDFTLWPFWVDTHFEEPFSKESDGRVYDRYHRELKYYRDVPAVLENLNAEGYKLAIASRTGDPVAAQSLLNLFDWNKYFHFKEMYPGRKNTHFQRIHNDSKIPYSQMIFFDDEPRNIFDISKLGVQCILVEDGVSKKLLEESLNLFDRQKK